MLPLSITVDGLTFEKQKDGQYFDTATTFDAPGLIQINNRNLIDSRGFPINNGQPAQITVTRLVTKNSTTPGAPDEVGKFWSSWQFKPGVFTVAECNTYLNQVSLFRAITDMMTRLHRAEL